ncbi:MAG: 50S ribosomal protein L29 [Verrucomicrobiaceae bacterium]
MKIEQLRELTSDEIRSRGRELKQEILQLRIQKTTGQLENKSAIRTLRKENARIETILSERRLEIVVGKPVAKAVKKQVIATVPVAKAPAVKKAAVKKTTAKKKTAE